jgi:hypothetical protein
MDLQSAIRNRSEIEFLYDGHPRVVRPAALGLHATTGNHVLRAYQIGGTGRSAPVPYWHLFLVNKMKFVVVTGMMFAANPVDYVRGDSAMATIFAEL